MTFVTTARWPLKRGFVARRNAAEAVQRRRGRRRPPPTHVCPWRCRPPRYDKPCSSYCATGYGTLPIANELSQNSPHSDTTAGTPSSRRSINLQSSVADPDSVVTREEWKKVKLDSKSSQSETLKKMGIPVTNQESLDALYDKIYEDTSDTTCTSLDFADAAATCCRTKT